MIFLTARCLCETHERDDRTPHAVGETLKIPVDALVARPRVATPAPSAQFCFIGRTRANGRSTTSGEIPTDRCVGFGFVFTAVAGSLLFYTPDALPAASLFALLGIPRRTGRNARARTQRKQTFTHGIYFNIKLTTIYMYSFCVYVISLYIFVFNNYSIFHLSYCICIICVLSRGVYADVYN